MQEGYVFLDPIGGSVGRFRGLAIGVSFHALSFARPICTLSYFKSICLIGTSRWPSMSTAAWLCSRMM